MSPQLWLGYRSVCCDDVRCLGQSESLPVQARQPLPVDDQLSLMRLVLTICCRIGGVVTLVVAHRCQWVFGENLASPRPAQCENVKLFTERFTAATGRSAVSKRRCDWRVSMRWPALRRRTDIGSSSSLPSYTDGNSGGIRAGSSAFTEDGPGLLMRWNGGCDLP
jgi:hypothetical protein